jgi:hypothetical protein
MPSEKFCTRCKVWKSTTEFAPNAGRQDGLQVYCRPCWISYRNGRKEKTAESWARWYAKNAEQQRKQAVDKYWANRDVVRERRKKVNRDPEEYARHVASVMERTRKIKAEVFTHYGTSCACCGESNPGFLTIDHINGCTREERKTQGIGSRFYCWLRKNGFPEGFQTLCYNCNSGRATNGGICPHKAQKRNKTVHHRRTKLKVFNHYGRKCACCGESNDGLLSIDHINGCKREMREQHGLGSHFYRWLVRNHFPEGFQTLCLSCNMGRSRNGGICPHKMLIPESDPVTEPSHEEESPEEAESLSDWWNIS